MSRSRRPPWAGSPAGTRLCWAVTTIATSMKGKLHRNGNLFVVKMRLMPPGDGQTIVAIARGVKRARGPGHEERAQSICHPGHEESACV